MQKEKFANDTGALLMPPPAPYHHKPATYLDMCLKAGAFSGDKSSPLSDMNIR
ncbi:hypothetical protein ACI0FM_12975 [Paenochrobactrum sp. BZR 588]|uniref:hypothetical protein n=1 Tax=Paenochrobactrum sp. BZR 588 TaxID=3378076 RepID=UPI003854E165